MNKPSAVRSWLKFGILSAGKTIVLAALGPQLGGFVLLVVGYLFGFRAQQGGAR